MEITYWLGGQYALLSAWVYVGEWSVILLSKECSTWKYFLPEVSSTISISISCEWYFIQLLNAFS